MAFDATENRYGERRTLFGLNRNFRYPDSLIFLKLVTLASVIFSKKGVSRVLDCIGKLGEQAATARNKFHQSLHIGERGCDFLRSSQELIQPIAANTRVTVAEPG